MNELLTALVAAAKVGFEAPNCHLCLGDKTRHEYREDAFGNPSVVDTREPCRMCHATGLDASDPERLIGHAFVRLYYKHRMSLRAIDGALDLDGTPAGLATALLRLVAQGGGAA